MRVLSKALAIVGLVALTGFGSLDASAEDSGLRLLLPETLYAVPGIETNVYFDNVVLAVNPANYAFDVTCAKGRQFAERWAYTPADGDEGDHSFSLTVLDQSNRVVAKGQTTIRVVPRNAGSGQQVSALLIGDSLTHASIYSEHLLSLCEGAGNPKLTLVGTHCPKGVEANRHEGYGGWTAQRFVEHFTGVARTGEAKKRGSPFLYAEASGTPKLDYKRYCDEANGGTAPDIVTIFLGCNDTFGATDANIEEVLDRVVGHMDTLVAMVHGVNPATKIGFIAPVPPAATQDAFAYSYKSGQTRWQYKRNQHRAVERMQEHFGGRETENISIIPAYTGLDCLHNYPKANTPWNARAADKASRLSNGVHPAAEGYRQIGDALYCWLKAQDTGKEATLAVDYEVQLDTITTGFDKKTCWVHPRAGTIPGATPTVVMTMQKLLLSGSDIFYALNEMRTDDLGKTWSGPAEHTTLGRREEPGGTVAVICDFTPKWHAKTGKLLGTGHVARYKDNHLAKDRSRHTAYSVYNPEARTWAEWRMVDMPDLPGFYNSGAGCTQRIDLPNGEILLPFYFKAKGVKTATAAVMRCRFDGETLSYLEHGSEHTIAVERGFCEPSLAQFGGRFFLTLRNDVAGYVTSGTDGLHYDEPRKWTFDDGEELGSYNTQQHWVVHEKALFLVYTRRGLDNDHVFRHRAPLVMAQVDPERLCVIRSTERVLVPERGARLGNFAVTKVSDQETWVTVAEWMQPIGCEKYGSDNSVYAARLKWKE